MNKLIRRYMFLGLGAALVLAGMLVVGFNQRQASQKVSAIEAADMAGQPVETLRKDLADYAALHMGVRVSYELTGSYNRAVDSTKAAVAAASAANSQIYAEAQKQCAGKTDSVTQARCNQEYLASRLQPTNSPNLIAPQLSNFKTTVVSPAFAPDLAGALLAGGILACLYGIFNLITQRRRR